MKSQTLWIGVALCLLVGGSVLAQTSVVFKYDQFDPDISVAATQIAGISLSTQPGFAAQEAFGQVYRPSSGQYPVKVTGIDVIMASPPNMSGTAEVNAQIEVWAHTGTGAAPTGNAPLWSITTADLYNPNTGQYGMPIQGNTANVITFDQSDPANHPPDINSGAFLVMIRFLDPAKDMTAEWGTMQCSTSLGCGCQDVGTIEDQATTQNANVMNILTSGCSGSAGQWAFANAIGVTGDFILRAHADVGGCTPACTGKNCGPDGCSGQCGTCGTNQTCNANGQCVCVPACTGKQCGPDGCSGQCGTCASNETCNSSGQCICVPACTNKQCGADGCGGQCGSCGTNETCNANGQCVACTPQCTGKHCGADSCGGQCGTCGTNETCDANGQCVACTPQCTGKQCGTDGCGGQCGTCQVGMACDGSYQCVPSGGVSIQAISPEFGYNDVETPVSITGGGFKSGATVKLGGTNLSAVQIVSAALISATVPSGMEPAKYMLIVVNSDSGTASLVDAFEVRLRACTPVCSGKLCGPDTCGGQCGTCETGQTCNTSGQCVKDTGKSGGCSCGGAMGFEPLWLLALVVGLAVLRRRLA